MWTDYWHLLHDGAHWLFELTLMGIVDGLIGLVAWPTVKWLVRRHDQRHHEPVWETRETRDGTH